MIARALMVQGTGSDVGKSLLVAGLCRAFTRRGLRVVPFKPQNMSTNAAALADGSEIGRAQALQAQACGIEPVADMNPILLKPEAEGRCQIVAGGRRVKSVSAREWLAERQKHLPETVAAFGRLAERADLVLAEGAGSPAEVNLRQGDVANMGFAQACGCPVALVGDIDRGGVVASLLGTLVALEASDAERIKGFIINRLRGDPTLFDDGVAFLEARMVKIPCLGVIPFLNDAETLPDEDSFALDRRLDRRPRPPRSDGAIRVVVPRLPRIANFDDLDPLIAENDVDVEFVASDDPLPLDADLIVLAGSKATLADLRELRRRGWDIDIKAHARRGGRILGICGGLQMLGRRIADPLGIESGRPDEDNGLGLLDLNTEFVADKRVIRVVARHRDGRELLRGYEMRLGRINGEATRRPFLRVAPLDRESEASDDVAPEGALSPCGRVAGTHVHGLFASAALRRALLDALRRDASLDLAADPERAEDDATRNVDIALDRIAERLERHLDLERLLALAEKPKLS